MNIGVYHNQPSGGARRALHGFSRELARRHRIETFTLSTSDQELLTEQATVAEFRPRRPITFGLFLNDIRRRLDLRDLERLNAALAREIDGRGFDVVLVDVCRFTGAPHVLSHLRTPAAYYCHEPPRAFYEDSWQPFSTRYERLRRVWHAPLEGRFARRLATEDASHVRAATAVLTNSRFTQSRIRAIYGVGATVCPPGVDIPEPARATSSHRAYVVSVGALEPHKAFEFLIDAIGVIPPESRPELRLVANAQNLGYRRSLEHKAQTGGVNLSIKLRLDDIELTREYQGAAAFVYAAHDEPLGLAPLEAMAHERAVLAVGEGGLLETVADGRTGLLVPRDPRAFAERLQNLLASPERTRELGRRARERVVRDWNWQTRATCLERVLQEVVADAKLSVLNVGTVPS